MQTTQIQEADFFLLLLLLLAFYLNDICQILK